MFKDIVLYQVRPHVSPREMEKNSAQSQVRPSTQLLLSFPPFHAGHSVTWLCKDLISHRWNFPSVHKNGIASHTVWESSTITSLQANISHHQLCKRLFYHSLSSSLSPLQTIAWYTSQANNLFCDRKEGRLVLRFRYHAIKQGRSWRGRQQGGSEGGAYIKQAINFVKSLGLIGLVIG